MSISPGAVTQAVDHLAAAVRLGDADRIEADVENIVAVVTEVLVFGEGATLEEARLAMHQLYSLTRIDANLEERNDRVVGQLQALTTLISIGAQQRKAGSLKGVVERYRGIISALSSTKEPLDNQALASRADVTEETVARAMPQLRELGIVTTTRDWRRRINQLTKEGLSAAREAGLIKDPPREAVQSADAHADSADDATAVRTEPVSSVRIRRAARALGQAVHSQGGNYNRYKLGYRIASTLRGKQYRFNLRFPEGQKFVLAAQMWKPDPMATAASRTRDHGRPMIEIRAA
jgi:hypothetical protein